MKNLKFFYVTFVITDWLMSKGHDRSECRAQLVNENSLAIEICHYITPTKWPDRYKKKI